jgi:hypothetical protein
MLFTLENKQPVRCFDHDKWSEFMNFPGNVIQYSTQVDVGTSIAQGRAFRVSTVFLGVNTHPDDAESPLIFETMIFGLEEYSNYQVRSTTYREAFESHNQALGMLGLDPVDWVDPELSPGDTQLLLEPEVEQSVVADRSIKADTLSFIPLSDLRVGQYVLATRWDDRSWNEIWVIGCVRSIKSEAFRMSSASGGRKVGRPEAGLWHYATAITPEQGQRINKLYTRSWGNPFNPKQLEKIFAKSKS